MCFVFDAEEDSINPFSMAVVLSFGEIYQREFAFFFVLPLLSFEISSDRMELMILRSRFFSPPVRYQTKRFNGIHFTLSIVD